MVLSGTVAGVDAKKRRFSAIDRASKRVDATKRRWPSSTHFELGEEERKGGAKTEGERLSLGTSPSSATSIIGRDCFPDLKLSRHNAT